MKFMVLPYSHIKIMRMNIPKQQIPKIRNRLLEIPAVKLADMIRRREVSKTAVSILYWIFVSVSVTIAYA